MIEIITDDSTVTIIKDGIQDSSRQLGTVYYDVVGSNIRLYYNKLIMVDTDLSGVTVNGEQLNAGNYREKLKAIFFLNSDGPVTSVNGLTGVVTLTATNIQYDSNSTIKYVLDFIETQIIIDELSLVRVDGKLQISEPWLSGKVSNKVDKVGNTTTYNQIYIKLPNGLQGMYNMATNILANSVMQRNSAGQSSAAAPGQDDHVTNRKYVHDLFGLYNYDIKIIESAAMWDMNNKFGKLTLNENVKISVYNKSIGNYKLFVTNGGGIITFSEDFKFPGGKVPTPSGSGMVDIYEFSCIDEILYMTGFMPDFNNK